MMLHRLPSASAGPSLNLNTEYNEVANLLSGQQFFKRIRGRERTVTAVPIE